MCYTLIIPEITGMSTPFITLFVLLYAFYLDVLHIYTIYTSDILATVHKCG